MNLGVNECPGCVPAAGDCYLTVWLGILEGVTLERSGRAGHNGPAPFNDQIASCSSL
jgi:hypothetical protein